VRLVERVDQANVIATFRRGEIDSPRFREPLLASLAAVGAGEDLVRRADVDDGPANDLRAAAFERFRGDYLGDWFYELQWTLVELDPDEVLAIRYIAWDYWLEITGGTRMPLDGAAYHRARGEDVRFERGGQPPIVVRAAPGSHLVVVEGHWRLTALAMHPDELPPALRSLLGEGEAVRRWGCY
jgi:hypothetical protein